MAADPKPSTPSATASQVVALSYTYRIILKVLFTGPLVLFGTYFAFMTLFHLLDAVTNHHTILTVGLIAGTWHLAPGQILKFAPDEAQAKETAKKLSYQLPVVVIVSCILFARLVVTPVGRWTGIQEFLTLSPPTVPLITILRLAIGSFLLGFGVCLRYIGPPSIGKYLLYQCHHEYNRRATVSSYPVVHFLNPCFVPTAFSPVRCSSSPLAIHPMHTSFRLISTDWRALLQLITRPSREQVIATGKKTQPPRRFQWPDVRAALSQVLITITFSTAAALLSIVPFTRDDIHGAAPMKLAITTVVIVTNIAHLTFSSLDGEGHELNPLRYGGTAGLSTYLWLIPNFNLIFSSVLGAAIVYASFFWSTDWIDMFECLLIAFVVAAHAIVFDSILKASLCATPHDLMRTIESCVGDGSPELFLTVILQSICHSNDDLVKLLSKVATTQIWLDLETDEKKRNENAISTIAESLLYKSPWDDSGAPLEEDILRWAIVSAISHWADEGSTDEWKTLKEPFFVPICRALCAYFGGLGEALVRCTSTKGVPDQWMMSPGSVALAQFSMRGATRCLISAISNNPMVWRNSHLATLIPALLASLYSLENGLLCYAQKLGKTTPKPVLENEKIELIRSKCPQHQSLFATVDDCSRSLLQTITEGTQRSEVLAPCDRELQKWCDDKTMTSRTVN